MHLSEVVTASSVVASTSSRGKKIELLADVLRRLASNEIAIAIGFFTGWPRQGKLGIGWATLDAARPPNAAEEATLTLAEVDQTFTALKSVKGSNSAAQRRRLLGDLMARATSAEQQFLFALGVGEVRQGALEGVMTEAVAKAANLPADRVRRAAMFAGDLGAVA